MKCTVDEIAPDLYRLSTFVPDFGIGFNQFLLADDEPVLIHTGFRSIFAQTLDGVSQVIDPATVRWVGYSHFESDECGALNDWLRVAPGATPVCSVVSAMVNLADFSERPARGLADGEVLETGRHRLRFLQTPHLPHGWDAGLFFEEVDATLLCSDLFFAPGETEALIEDGVVARAREAMLAGVESPLAKDVPFTPYTMATLERLAGLEPRVLAVMHGASYRGDGGAAIRELARSIEEVHGRAV